VECGHIVRHESLGPVMLQAFVAREWPEEEDVIDDECRDPDCACDLRTR